MEILKNYKSSFILLGAILLGSLVGNIMGEGAKIFEPVANLFLNLLYCLVVPMIFISLVSSIANAQSNSKLGKIIFIMMVIFALSEIIAALFMLFFTQFYEVATTYNFGTASEFSKGNSDFLSMFSVGNFYELFSRSNLTALIVFSLIFGVALLKLKDTSDIVIKFFAQLNEVIVKMVSFVMFFAPLGLGCFFAVLIGTSKGMVTADLSKAILVYFIAAIIYYFVSNFILAYLAGGFSGAKKYFKYIITPTLVSLGTCSSAATIPSNLIAGKNIGISDEVKNLVVPFGCNLHKSGAVLITILKITFMCSVFGVDLFTFDNLITAIFVSVLASSVMGAIPAGGYVGEIFIISAFGFPPEAIPVMVLIGTITDAPATAINATNDVSAAMLVDKIVNKTKF